MKILQYIPTYAPAWSFGGPVRSVSLLSEGLAALGCEVHVLTTLAGVPAGEAIPPNQPIDRNGVTVTYFETSIGLGISSLKLKRAVRNRLQDFDLVHVTGVWQPTAVAACRTAERIGVPYVVSPRGALSPYSWTAGRLKKTIYYFLAERRNIRNAAGIHYTSDLERRECLRFRLQGLPVVIANGLDFSFWQRDEAGAKAFRQSLKLTSNTKIAIFSGRIHHKKNLDFLLPVLARLPEWHLVVAGFDEGGEAARWLARAAGWNVQNRITMLGGLVTTDLRSAYSAADAFVMPSHHENFANAALEAAACGCPVFLSTGVGLGEELVLCGKAKSLPLHEDLWIDALRLAEPLSGTSSADLQKKFSRCETAACMLRFYKSILKERT